MRQDASGYPSITDCCPAPAFHPTVHPCQSGGLAAPPSQAADSPMVSGQYGRVPSGRRSPGVFAARPVAAAQTRPSTPSTNTCSTVRRADLGRRNLNTVTPPRSKATCRRRTTVGSSRAPGDWGASRCVKRSVGVGPGGNDGASRCQKKKLPDPTEPGSVAL